MAKLVNRVYILQFEIPETEDGWEVIGVYSSQRRAENALDDIVNEDAHDEYRHDRDRYDIWSCQIDE